MEAYSFYNAKYGNGPILYIKVFNQPNLPCSWRLLHLLGQEETTTVLRFHIPQLNSRWFPKHSGPRFESHIKPVGTLTNFKDEFSDRNEITIWWLKPIYMKEIFSFPPPIHCFLTLTNCTGAFCHMPCQFEIHHPWFLYVLQNRPKRHALPIIARWVLTLRDPSWLLETQNWGIWDGSNFYGLDFTEWMLGMWTGDIDSYRYLDNHFLYGIGLFNNECLGFVEIDNLRSPLDPAVTR